MPNDAVTFAAPGTLTYSNIEDYHAAVRLILPAKDKLAYNDEQFNTLVNFDEAAKSITFEKSLLHSGLIFSEYFRSLPFIAKKISDDQSAQRYNSEPEHFMPIPTTNIIYQGILNIRECDFPGGRTEDEFIKTELQGFEVQRRAQSFSHVSVPTVPSTVKSESDLATFILQKQKGLIFGEKHSEARPKELIISLLAALKDSGVTTLYMEHLLSDDHQALLDGWVAGSPMPTELKIYVQALDEGNGIAKHYPNNFLGLLEKAKEQNIRIVAIDNETSYLRPGKIKDYDYKRYMLMNYVARGIIEKDRLAHPEGKYIALVGSAHVGIRNETAQDHVANSDMRQGSFTVPGLDKLLGVPSLVTREVKIEELKQPDRPTPFIAENVNLGNRNIQADYVLQEKSAGALQFERFCQFLIDPNKNSPAGQAAISELEAHIDLNHYMRLAIKNENILRKISQPSLFIILKKLAPEVVALFCDAYIRDESNSAAQTLAFLNAVYSEMNSPQIMNRTMGDFIVKNLNKDLIKKGDKKSLDLIFYMAEKDPAFFQKLTPFLGLGEDRVRAEILMFMLSKLQEKLPVSVPEDIKSSMADLCGRLSNLEPRQKDMFSMYVDVNDIYLKLDKIRVELKARRSSNCSAFLGALRMTQGFLENIGRGRVYSSHQENFKQCVGTLNTLSSLNPLEDNMEAGLQRSKYVEDVLNAIRVFGVINVQYIDPDKLSEEEASKSEGIVNAVNLSYAVQGGDIYQYYRGCFIRAELLCQVGLPETTQEAFRIFSDNEFMKKHPALALSGLRKLNHDHIDVGLLMRSIVNVVVQNHLKSNPVSSNPGEPQKAKRTGIFRIFQGVDEGKEIQKLLRSIETEVSVETILKLVRKMPGNKQLKEQMFAEIANFTTLQPFLPSRATTKHSSLGKR